MNGYLHMLAQCPSSQVHYKSTSSPVKFAGHVRHRSRNFCKFNPSVTSVQNVSGCRNLRKPVLLRHVHAASIAVAAAEEAAGDPGWRIAPEEWSDGDVLQLQLSDGRHVYAEVFGTQPTHTTGSPQTPRPNGARPGSVHPSAPQLHCLGSRYNFSSDSYRSASSPGGWTTLNGQALVLKAAGGEGSGNFCVSHRNQ